MQQGITGEVKKQAEQRINSRCTMYVTGIHNLALKKTQKGSTLWKLCRIAKTEKKARDYLGSAKKQIYGTIMERHLEDDQYQRRMNEQGYTQSDMEEIDRIASEKKIDVRRFF